MSTRAEDIARLKAHCSLLKGLPDRVVEELYSSFSEERWCAGWIYVDDFNADEFADYCIELWSGEGL